jgi:hypothetical protein
MKYTYAAGRYSFCVFFIFLFAPACSVPLDGSTGTRPSGTRGIPRLVKQKAATQLVVDGEPFLILGGELRNSSSSSLDYMKPIWPKLARMNLSTVLAPISWELLEPEEGTFDFTLVDGLINGAWMPGRRQNGDENAQGGRFTVRDASRIYRINAYRYR